MNKNTCTNVSGDFSFSKILILNKAKPALRHVSGKVVFEEELSKGRLVTRYWSAGGQIWPDMHLDNQVWRVDEQADTFVVGIDGRELSGGWEWVEAVETPDPGDFRGAGRAVRHSVIRLQHKATQIEAAVHTRIDGGPFLIRWLEITNRAGHSQAITEAAPWAGALWNHRAGENLAENDSNPFLVAWNHRRQQINEGDFWFQEIAPGYRLIEDNGRQGRSGFSRPAFWARNRHNGQTVVCELGWGGNWVFSLDHTSNFSADRASQQCWHPRSHGLFFRMGLAGHSAALRVLKPGETARTPAAHLGFFQEDDDAIVHACHDHVLNVVTPEQIAGRTIEIEANHRGYHCDRETEEGLKRDVEVARAVGTEVYTVDAGWYGRPPNQWWNAVGDWDAGPWLPNGLEPVVEHARKQGMRFGLWAEIEAAGAHSALKEKHPDWLMTHNGQLVANGRALDLSKPEVAAWCESEVDRLIRRYKLDLYRLDHNHSLLPMGNREVDGIVEDLGWRYYEAFDCMFKNLAEKHPGVVFQNCASGGGRLDWGTMHRFHNAELSDCIRQPRSLKILNGLTMSLPPALLMRTYGTEASELVLDADIDTQLRAALICRPIFRGIAPTVDELTPWLNERIAHHLEIFNKVLRPLLLDGRLFHHTPFLPIHRADSWVVLEYAGTARDRAAVALFRQAPVGEDIFLLRPRGLNPANSYRMRSENHGWSVNVTGAELAQGLPVLLERVMSSELLVFEALP